MRKVIAVLVLGSLLAGAFEASSALAAKKKKKKTRTAVLEYTGSIAPNGAPANFPCVQDQVGCVIFEVKKSERYVALEIADTAGQPVYASVYVYGYTDGNDGHEHICATTTAPLPMIPGLSELVLVIGQTTGGATNPCAGPATQGTVTAKFSNLP